MHNVRKRLAKCFCTVFPEFSTEEIVNTPSEVSDNWDSMSAVTLLAVVQEEFGIDLEVDDMESLASFEGILERVNEVIRRKAPSESPVADQASA